MHPAAPVINASPIYVSCPPVAGVFTQGYDATKNEGRRRPASGVLRSEDSELMPLDRRKLVSSSRDITRNFSLAQWMIGKHLDYVSTFRFQSRSGNKPLDRHVEAIIKEKSKAKNFDIAGRHSLRRMIRLGEACRTVDGDILFIKLQAMKVQAVEGDRIRNPDGGVPGGDPTRRYVHGVEVDAAGAATGYVINRRLFNAGQMLPSSSMQFERVVSAKNAFLHGYWKRFDQTRGISPLASALNSLHDAYQGIDYALAKMKVSQLFGLVFTRTSAEDMGTTTDGVDDDDAPNSGPGKTDFGRGPVSLELDEGEDAHVLESNTPSNEFQSFLQNVIALSLKALDIPYSFFAENFSNYSGSRQALLQYDQSCEHKREDNLELLDDWTPWMLQAAIEDGGFRQFPAVKTVADLPYAWVSVGLPWIDPQREVNANLAAIGGGLTSRQRILAAQGENAFEVFDELEQENKYLSDRGLPVGITPQNSQVVEVQQQ